MVLRLGNRDRSGRKPVASRGDTFYQSVNDWSVPGNPEPPDMDLQPLSTQEPYFTDDMARGSGY